MSNRGVSSTNRLDYPRVLHLGDPAHTATLLTLAAHASRRNWRVLQLEKPPQAGSQLTRTLQRAVRGLAWEARLLGAKTMRPRVHLHSAMALPHAGWALGDYALHLHGTDIRSRRYEQQFSQRIFQAVSRAHTVFYSTPDLAEHILDWRPEARLVPVPVRLESPLVPNPLSSLNVTKYVFFVSRFEAVKGGETQIAAAKALRSVLPDSITLVGLDWGDPDLRRQACEAGVRLIPRQSPQVYRQIIRDAAACIGQTAGILSASELESLVENVPLVVPLNPDWYAADHPSLRKPPVLGGTSLAAGDSDRIAQLVEEAIETPRPITRPWVQQYHSPEAAFAEVIRGYRDSKW